MLTLGLCCTWRCVRATCVCEILSSRDSEKVVLRQGLDHKPVRLRSMVQSSRNNLRRPAVSACSSFFVHAEILHHLRMHAVEQRRQLDLGSLSETCMFITG